MPQEKYRRTVSELRKLASMFWPSELSEEVAKLSVIPVLLKTQDDFIAILSVPVPDLSNLFQVINASSFSGNLFLKHLVILADFGGEQLQRVNSKFEMLFPSGKMDYLWNGEPHTYAFQELPVSNLTNSKLGITSKKLLKERKFDKLLQDVAAILIFGSACTNEVTADVLNKCEIGSYLGQSEELERFIKQRYIWVSRITNRDWYMNDQQVFNEMISVYAEAIPEMKLLGEIDWYNAARVTRRRLASNLHKGLNLSSIQLARECHADLQGYVEVKFGSNVMDAKSCYNKGCFGLHLLSQHLIQIGGSPRGGKVTRKLH